LKGKFLRICRLYLMLKPLYLLLGASSIQPAPYEFRQGRKAAAVVGRSGVIWVACPLFLSALLNVIRDMFCVDSAVFDKQTAGIHPATHHTGNIQSFPVRF
jgi:hypothetical protein